MELNADNIANLTQYLIREYYKLNTEPLFSVLAEDCVWLEWKSSGIWRGRNKNSVLKWFYYACLSNGKSSFLYTENW